MESLKLILHQFLLSDLIDHIVIPYAIIKCRKCPQYLSYEEELKNKRDTCERCQLSICLLPGCTFRGTEYDFHVIPLGSDRPLFICVDCYESIYGSPKSPHKDCDCYQFLLSVESIDRLKSEKFDRDLMKWKRIASESPHDWDEYLCKAALAFSTSVTFGYPLVLAVYVLNYFYQMKKRKEISSEETEKNPNKRQKR